jgi:hypothetical protein
MPYPASYRGVSVQHLQTRGGERWPGNDLHRRCGASARRSKPQASRRASRAPRGPADGGEPARSDVRGHRLGPKAVDRQPPNSKGKAGCLKGKSTGGGAEQAYKHRARDAGEPAPRGNFSLCIQTHDMHRAAGRSSLVCANPRRLDCAGAPAFRAPSLFGGGDVSRRSPIRAEAEDYGVPGAAKNTAYCTCRTQPLPLGRMSGDARPSRRKDLGTCKRLSAE